MVIKNNVREEKEQMVDCIRDGHEWQSMGNIYICKYCGKQVINTTRQIKPCAICHRKVCICKSHLRV